MGTTILSNPFVQILLVIVVPIILYISKYEVYPSIKQNLGIKDEEEPDKGGTWIVITGFSVLAVILAIFAGVKSGHTGSFFTGVSAIVMGIVDGVMQVVNILGVRVIAFIALVVGLLTRLL
jgi:hypothetical protein